MHMVVLQVLLLTARDSHSFSERESARTPRRRQSLSSRLLASFVDERKKFANALIELERFLDAAHPASCDAL